MEWTRGPTIGRGSTATVSIATTTSGNQFAVKSSVLSHSTFLQKEQHFLSQLNSSYIVEYMGFDVTYDDNNPMYNLFLEYVPGGTLSDAIMKQGGSLDEKTIQFYTNQILKGLNYLHLNGLVHCDIKPQNVLIGKNGAKIADLGCAKIAADVSKFSGTPVFMAPEVARGEEQCFAADIWALGCTIIEMATGSNPWPETDDTVSALYKIGYSGELPKLPSWLSGDAKDFLSKCLMSDTKDRWAAKQLLDHSFMQNLESDLIKTEECTRNSPTCVLEQGFWDSLEVSEIRPNSTSGSIGGSNFSSPAERFRGLEGGCLPNWAGEEDWITVRTNHTEENGDMINPNESQISSIGSSMFSLVDVEELESSIEFDEISLVWSINGHSGDNSRINLLLYDRFRDVYVSRFLNFEKQINDKLVILKFHLSWVFCIIEIKCVFLLISYVLFPMVTVICDIIESVVTLLVEEFCKVFFYCIYLQHLVFEKTRFFFKA